MSIFLRTFALKLLGILASDIGGKPLPGKDSKMNIEEFREYCLTFEGVTEKTPFGKFAARYDSVLVFYVCNHIFCMVDMECFTYVVVKNTPECIASLHDTRQSCESQRNMSARHWIQLNFGGDISDGEILDLVKQSYEIVKAKYTKPDDTD